MGVITSSATPGKSSACFLRAEQVEEMRQQMADYKHGLARELERAELPERSSTMEIKRHNPGRAALALPLRAQA